MVQIHSSAFSKTSIDLATMVVKKGIVLIKDIPDLKTVHSLLKSKSIIYKKPNYITPAHYYITPAHSTDYPSTVEISNIVNPKTKQTGWLGDKELPWHCDDFYSKNTAHCIALYCQISSLSEGGETQIINNRKVYNDLSKEEREVLTDIEVQYSTKSYLNFASSSYKKKYFKSVFEQSPVLTKKLVCKHPIDQAYGLHFPFDLMDFDKSKPSLKEKNKLLKLKETCLNKKYQTSIKLEKKDLLLMDQIHTIHKRTKFKGKRQLFRILFYWNNDKIKNKIKKE